MHGKDEDRQARARRRRSWPIRRYRLGDEPEVSVGTTPEERLAMMWPLTKSAWALSRRPMPDYRREEAPGRVIRPDAGPSK